MKFLVDENLSPRLAAWLKERGHDALHVHELALTGRPDSEIGAMAAKQQRIIVTQDADFEGPGAHYVPAARLMPTPALLARLEAEFQLACRRFEAGERIVVLS